MQPKTSKKIDEAAFNRIKKTTKNMLNSQRMQKKEGCFATPVPEEIGLQLTNQCNLRCRHCFEWNDKGYNHELTKDELDTDLNYEVIEQVLEKTRSNRANLYLWGGEPMVYSQWNRLCTDLETEKRWSVLCTNGILVEDKMDSLLKISENLAILTSVEGFEKENDCIRGKGSYQKVMKGINEVLRLQKKGIFKGLQSIHITVSDAMIGKLYDFMEFCEEMGIDTVYFCLPWYIPGEVSAEMDEYYKKHFGWLGSAGEKLPNWHSFKFHIKEENITALQNDFSRIGERVWKCRVRYQPALEIDEIPEYVRGGTKTAQSRQRCLGACNRMDILTDGSVSSCKLFSEFTVGNLNHMKLEEVWHGEKFNKIRSHLANELMPVCSKCILLYLNGR